MSPVKLKTIPRQPPVNLKYFESMFESTLGENYERALRLFWVFQKYHPYGVTNILALAYQKGCVTEVLDMLERRTSKGELDHKFKELLQGVALCDACTDIIVSAGDSVDGNSTRDLNEADVANRVILGK